MDDFPGLLARDFGFKAQGKSAPMSASKASPGLGSGRSSGEVFGVPPRHSNPSPYGRSNPSSSPPLDPILDGFRDPAPKQSSLPVYDKPVYDDDIFDGVPGLKNQTSKKYDDVFAMMSSSGNRASSPPYNDLLDNLGRAMPEQKTKEQRSRDVKEQDFSGFDELLPGFGRSSSSQSRKPPETKQRSSAPSVKPTSQDPFAAFETTSTSAGSSSGLFTDSLEHNTMPMNSGSSKDDASLGRRGLFNEDLTKSMPSFTSKINTGRNGVLNPDTSASPYEKNGHLETADDVWLTVAEIPLFTQPTSAPPPSRLPPSVGIGQTPFRKSDRFSSFGVNSKARDTGSTSQSSNAYQQMRNSMKNSGSSPFDDEDIIMGKPQRYANEHVEVPIYEEETETNSAAAAMKEAMDRAEAKFKQAREVRERERDSKSAKNRESVQQERHEKAMPDVQYPEEDKDKQDKFVLEREQREREEKEEKKRREREREQELERERARQVVERATREARERAAAEARLKAERAAVEKANAEARQRAEQAARERAAAEAKGKAEMEKAATDARERERAATEAKEKAVARERSAVERAAQEARLRAQRAAVERVATEARERAAAEAQRRAAAAREKQQKTDHDLDSFFNVGARPSSAPKQRSPTSDTGFDAQSQNKGFYDGVQRTSTTGSSSTIRKTQSTTNISDDLASIFGAPSSSGEFQEVEGESEERRRARLERHQRTLERAAKALAEKNERDMQTQRDQAERNRIGETLDMEIKRWSAGKEGNLRALLSTMQYVLWPECGWQPVSLTDLITGASVKKVYRKATLCIHPDKVQQKGATLQQKFIAEKVFDLLKEAWNKFNSEELF